jgi:hypothetical protein
MKITILIAFTVLLAVTSVAQPINVKTGLWETTATSQVSGMPPIPAEALARLTPDQRAKMEQAMGGGGGPRTTTMKSCVTQEMLDKALNFGDNKDQNCKRTLVSSSATKQEIHMECAHGQDKTTSDIHFEAVDRTTVKGTMTMNSAAQGGRGMSMKVDFSSKYLGADCGDVGKAH